MDDLTEAKRQIDVLPKLLKEDFRILFKIHSEFKDAKTGIFPKITDLIEEAYGLPESPPKVQILIFQHMRLFTISKHDLYNRSEPIMLPLFSDYHSKVV